MESKRERRIRDRLRNLERARRIFRRWPHTGEEWMERVAVRNFNNLKSCSCALCCNARRKPMGESKFTLAERRQRDKERDNNGTCSASGGFLQVSAVT